MRDRDAWSGTATSLLDDLSRVTPPAARAALPKTQTWVVRHVHRLEPALRRLGLVVSDGPRTSDTRTIQITRVRASGRGVGGPTPSTGSDPTEGAIARSTVAPACDPVDVGDGSDANDGKLAENS